MIAKIMGIGDLIVACIIPFSGFLSVPLILLSAKWLIIKGGIFALAGNMISIIDVLCGIYIIFLAYGWNSTILSVLCFIWILQKGIISLI